MREYFWSFEVRNCILLSQSMKKSNFFLNSICSARTGVKWIFHFNIIHTRLYHLFVSCRLCRWLMHSVWFETHRYDKLAKRNLEEILSKSFSTPFVHNRIYLYLCRYLLLTSTNCLKYIDCTLSNILTCRENSTINAIGYTNASGIAVKSLYSIPG